jgi:hypothetical protein
MYRENRDKGKECVCVLGLEGISNFYFNSSTQQLCYYSIFIDLPHQK